MRPFLADKESEQYEVATTFRMNKTAEDKLVSVLDNFGPVVAVGMPGEEIPPLGAVRLYFEDTEWRNKVEALIMISQLVVIEAGFTDALEWEISTAIRAHRPGQIIISFLSSHVLHPSECQRYYEIFLILAGRLLSMPLSEFPQQISNGYFMYFDDDWTAHLSAPTMKSTKITPDSIKSALNPILIAARASWEESVSPGQRRSHGVFESFAPDHELK